MRDSFSSSWNSAVGSGLLINLNKHSLWHAFKLKKGIPITAAWFLKNLLNFFHNINTTSSFFYSANFLIHLKKSSCPLNCNCPTYFINNVSWVVFQGIFHIAGKYLHIACRIYCVVNAGQFYCFNLLYFCLFF